MSDYNANDIDDAKRRVEEMRRRAKDFVEEPKQEPTVHHKPAEKESLFSLFSKDMMGGDSSLILALVLILSREGADNMLILALLYILF